MGNDPKKPVQEPQKDNRNDQQKMPGQEPATPRDPSQRDQGRDDNKGNRNK